ncbi:MAG: DUF309 domain-containing protein [Chloroflexi bacterium]|nr:DUF309 domain-containing protein [Chloroflexota bacterium]
MASEPPGRRARDAFWLQRLRATGLPASPSPSYTPPPALYRGVQEFNDGYYFAAHETLEGVWRQEGYPLRLLYHGLIKAAVGLLHLARHNPVGARSQLGDALKYLEPFLPSLMGLQLDLLAQELALRLHLLSTPPAPRWEELDQLARPQILSIPPTQPLTEPFQGHVWDSE